MIDTSLQKAISIKQRENLLKAFEGLIQGSTQHALVNLYRCIVQMEQADPQLMRELNGHYLMNDIFQTIKKEILYRDQLAGWNHAQV